ncbi:MAG: hypothetical protein R3E79_00080 [Caldilineaceae bacterium]
MQLLIDQELLFWGVGVLLGLLAAVIVLNEVLERLTQQRSPLVKGLRQIRDFAIPAGAFPAFAPSVGSGRKSTLLIRIVTTLVWLTAAYTLFILLNGVDTLRAARRTGCNGCRRSFLP